MAFSFGAKTGIIGKYKELRNTGGAKGEISIVVLFSAGTEYG